MDQSSNKMEFLVTPYRICTSIFIKVYCSQKLDLKPKVGGRLCMFILDIIRQNEYSFKQLNELIEVNCESATLISQFKKVIAETIVDINNLFELVKQMRDCPGVDNNSVAGIYLRKVAIFFDRLTHQACSRLFDDLILYATSSSTLLRRRGEFFAWYMPRATKSSVISSTETPQSPKPIHQINHEIAKLQANEQRAMNPRELHEYLRRPNNSSKNEAIFLRYLNLLRVNETVGSKHLLMAYFDMVSDSVSRSYSALNYAIWYLHHGEYKRAIECLQECYCCAQAADDDQCLLIALMWLSRIVIQAKQKNSSKYNVTAMLELLRKRSHKASMPYVEAMSSMTLEQLTGPVDDSEILKKSSATLKQVALKSRQQNHLLATANQPNPLDKDDILPSAEILAVRHSMNDVLVMHYALLSAHLSLLDANQSSTLASQALLHFDLIEKCGNEDVFLVNENIFIALRNLAYHVWNSTRDFCLVKEILVDLCSTKIPVHRTDNHSIWRQALSEISFEYYTERENWCEASKMISIIRETDQDGAQLREAELLKLMGVHDEALERVDDLISRIEFEESNLSDPAESTTPQQTSARAGPGSAPCTRPAGDTVKHQPVERPNGAGGKLSNNKPELATPQEDHQQQQQGGHIEARHRQRRRGNARDVELSATTSHPSLSIEHKAFIKSKALLLQAELINDETKILECLQYATDNKFVHVRMACLTQLAKRWVDKSEKIVESIVIEVFANGTLKERQEFRKFLAQLSEPTVGDDGDKPRQACSA